MKKSTLIIILVIYVASIAVINFFGLSVKVYNEIINVSDITFDYQSHNDNYESYTNKGTRVITLAFEGPGFSHNEDGTTNILSNGTQIIIIPRVYPDNATKKGVEYIWNTANKRIEFVKDGTGRFTGTILFSAPTEEKITIRSTDGSKIETTFIISVE